MKIKSVFYTALAVLVVSVALAVVIHGGTRTEAAVSAAVEQPTPAQWAGVAESMQDEFAAVAEKVKPTVVYIDVTKPAELPQGYQFWEWGTPDIPLPPEFRDFFRFQNPRGQRGWQSGPNETPRKQDMPRGVGSGVIIDAKNGYVLTNNHVVDGATEIGVTLYNDKRYVAKLKGADPRTDLAVVKIDAPGLGQIEWGDSDALKVGHWVMAFGQPEGLKYTVTKGIVSAKGRANLGIIGGGDRLGGYEDFIQTDAAINPGNSGGPLTNIKGELVGINTAIATQGIPQWGGIGFAIPSNLAKRIAEQIIEKGEVVRGYIGVSISDASKEPPEPRGPAAGNAEVRKQYAEALRSWKEISAKLGDNAKGSYVVEVSKGDPAEAAGIKMGDIITKFGGKPIENVNDLRNAVAMAEVGSKVDTEVERLVDNKVETLPLKVEIAKQPKTVAETAAESEVASNVLGLTIQTLTPDIAEDFGYGKDEKGVVVVEVTPGSRAAKAGLEKDDLITQVKYKGREMKVESVDDFRQALSGIGDKDSFSVLRKRQGQSKYVKVE